MKRPRPRRLVAFAASFALVAALAVTARIVAADPPTAPLHATPAPPEPAQPAPPAAASTPASPSAPRAEKPVLLGAIHRDQVEAAVPDWVKAEADSTPDAKAARGLAAVPPGATVTIYMGSWCGDSKRELSRFWRALDLAGGRLPFAVSYVGVDRTKKEPAALVQGSDLRYVPTFIVQRAGHEVGRIVESAPNGIEHDLLSLLDGSAHGLISERTDLGEPGTPGGETPKP